MSTPTVGRFLPGYTGTRAAEPPRACIWQEDRNGKLVCVTRRTLHGAVNQWTKAVSQARTESAREIARKNRLRAMREHEAHHCTPAPEVGGSSNRLGQPSRHSSGEDAGSPAGTPAPLTSATTAPNPRTPHEQQGTSGPEGDGLGKPAIAVTGPRTSAGPVTRLDIDRHVLDLMGAAVVYGMRKERQAHGDAPTDTLDKIAEAERRMGDASDALHRALDRYQPGRRPIDHYLPGEEPRG